MSDLVVVAFPDPLRAEEVRLDLLRMQRDYLVDLDDAVVVHHTEDGKVKLRQLHNLTASGAIGGGFWGTLVGLLFLNPLFGLAVGSAAGAITGALSDAGINDKFMKELGESLQRGSSALCVLVRKVTADKVLDELKSIQGAKVLRTSLSHEDERKLREALGDTEFAESLQTA